jgi:hypothetical protein
MGVVNSPAGNNINAGIMGIDNTGTPGNFAGYFQGRIAIIDGTQQPGYVLTSDLYGTASWKAITDTGGFWTLAANGLDVYNNNTGHVGIGVDSANSTLQVGGSVAVPYAVVQNTGTYTLTASDHTIRRFGEVTNIAFPDASTCQGRVYCIISSNGAGGPVTLTPFGTQIVYDDVTGNTYTSLTAAQRITVQSDGSNWIVIGN